MTSAELKSEADSYLAALLHYTEGFYASAISHGMKAGPAADSVAHVEKAARSLHRLATTGASPAVAATVSDLVRITDRTIEYVRDLDKHGSIDRAAASEILRRLGAR